MLNRVILIGRLTRDPELRYTPQGVEVTQFTLAVDRSYSSNREEKETDFIPIVTWRQLAATCANYLRKGRLTAVEGRMQVRHYENNEGRRIYITEVVADNVRFLESVNREGSTNSNAKVDFSGTVASPSPKHPNMGTQTSSPMKNDPFASEGRTIDISDDDLPF